MESSRKIAPQKLALLVGIVCIGTYVVNYYLRNMLSVTSPDLLLSGSYTEDGIALLSSIYMVFYAGGQLVNGFLGDMLSPKLMILGGIGLGGLAMVVFPFLPYQALRVICFAVLGFGLSMVRGPLMKIISENTSPRHARFICVFFSFASFSGPLIASLFVMALPTKYAFIVSGIVAVLMALLATLILHALQKKELISFRPVKARGLRSITDVFRIEGFVFFMIIACLVEISAASVSFWIPTYLSLGLGFDPTAANLVFSAISICRACMPFVSLMIFNAIGERARPIMRVGFALSAGFFLAMQFVKAPVFNVVLLILALMSMSGVSAMLWSIYIPGLGKTGRASSANGVLDCSGYIAAALANLVFGKIMAGAGWSTVLLLWASVGVIGLITTFIFHKQAGSSISSKKQ
ncbi:MAG: MFS transporter [Clostridia bacterium]|nr:MFS transporter [Clostridia bacterium]